MDCHFAFTLLARVAWDPEGIGRSARNRQSLDARHWMILAVVFTLVVIGVAIWSWYLNRKQNRHRRYDSSLRLFWSLCRAHELRWADRWMLWQLVRYQKLDEPARIFLEPERLCTANLSPALRTRESEIWPLRCALFADLAQQETALPAADPSPVAETPPAASSSPVAPRPTLPNLDVPPWPGRNKPRGH